MPGLKLYHGNRLEKLVDSLVCVIKTPLSSPFKTEIIVVQSKGMERWLSIKLAESFGIWANCAFPFLDNFVGELFKCVLKEAHDTEFFSPQVMSWRIMDILKTLKEKPEFEQIKHYIDEDESQLKTFQLSEQIANVFDSYTVYRPEMVYKWNVKNNTGWQEILWHHLIKGHEDKNRVFILYKFLRELERNLFNDEKELPERISIFGISSLPDYYLNVIKAISRLIDVHIFFLNPTYKFWGDIVPERIIKKIGAIGSYFETGNPLLASMGKMGRDFFNAIIECADEEYDIFDEPEPQNLLTAIQYDIYHLLERGKDIEKTLISSEDISIQVHSCHSPLREIEVLHNNLLFLFERYDDLKPKDILVMTPDIEAYAPFISAVFEGQEEGKERIPYSISDRKTSGESPVVNLFLKILALLKSRFYASDVMDILDDILLKEKFKLNEGDIQAIFNWINDTNIRWGIDENHREAFDIPGFKENSWRAGIERLLLGYAMFTKDGEPFNGILPYNEMEGDYVDTLEKLLNFLYPLFDFSNKISGQRPLDEWADLLHSILDTFIIMNDETERHIQFIRETIQHLKKLKLSYGIESPVSFHVILHYLKGRLNIREYKTGFITGGVTFCEMLPMRSIPFKVIALIGMNNDTYPRESRPLGFDLIAKNPRRGDRSLRDEDRYIFLEAIISARLCLYISYIGQSIKDNSEIPPSVVISKLLDYIEKGFYHPEKRPIEIILKRHPLQPFNPRYFQKDSLIYNYSKEDYETVKNRLEKKYIPSPFIITPLKDTSSGIKHITNSELKRFFRHPVKYFFNNRLGIFLDEISLTVKDDEPMELDTLDEFNIKQRLIEHLVSFKGLDKIKKTISLEGILPPGSQKKVFFDDVSLKVEDFFKDIQVFLKDKKEPMDFKVEVNNFHVSVRLEEIYSYGLIRYRTSKDIKARYLIDLWIDHLFFNLFAENSSLFLSMEKKYIFKPVDNARELITRLLMVYDEGLKSPIKLFPETSYTYAKQLKKKGEHIYAIESARDKWDKNDFLNIESIDPYYQVCFKGVDPLDDDFIHLSKEVFGPLVEDIINE
ncbi:MAG TPA: exodeoxyribonuclease V subunit gamma [Syntrophorhabdaceae bacterium]|nr:exodeoxyribonuclease V subunit gamma [Syntrophorhabdaceae bacterium]